MRELAQEVLAGQGGLGRRRSCARRAPRPRGGRSRHRLPRAGGDGSGLREALRRRALSALRAARRLAGRARRLGGRSTSRRWTTASRTTSRRGTSRSTRSPSRWQVAIRSTRTAGRPTWRRRSSAPSRRRSSPTIRCGSCARSGSRTSSASGSSPRRSGSCGSRRSSSREPARERSLAELVRLSVDGYRRADELGLLAPLEGSSAGLDRPGARRPARIPARRGLRRRAPAVPGLERDEAVRARSCCVRSGPRTDRRARSTGSGARPSPGRSTRSSSWARRSSRPRSGRRRRTSPPEPLLRGDELGLAAGAGDRTPARS